MIRTAVAAGLLLIIWQPAAGAQGVDGSVAILADVLPNMRDDAGDRRPVSELRSRVVAEYRRDLGHRIRLTASGFIEAVIGDRAAGAPTRAAIVRPQELNLEAVWPHADLRVGYSRVVWGRLDEFLPTDVVNPLDLTRFFLEGRAEARMAVGLVRARWLPADTFTLEGIYVPVFRPGSFDQLDEGSAPFNLGPRSMCAGGGPPALANPPLCLTVDVHRAQPAATLRHAQGGVRASATTGRVDWSLSAYRGFEPFPLYRLVSTTTTGSGVILGIDEQFPRFTMIGADFETVRGAWGIRGEVAGFVARRLQSAAVPDPVASRTLDAGIGVDRKAGAYRVSGNVMLSTRWETTPSLLPTGIDRTDVMLVASLDRSFARETRTLRAFGVYNPGEQSAFARMVGAVNLRDNLWLEGSGGWFRGGGGDALSRFADRDFVYLRFKVFF